jgi:hypothetical protein
VTIQNRRLTFAACTALVALAQSFSQTIHSPKSYSKEATISESAGTTRIVANSPRPLAQVLDGLRQKYGWAVDYEDPQFISKMDVVETNEAGKSATDSNLPSQLPAGGAFTLEFPSSAPVEEKVLQLAVDRYNQSDNPGRFELRSNKQGAFFVVGVKSRDTHDKVASQSPLLDEPVTLVSQQRTALDAVNLICQAVAAQRGITVTLGIFPRRVLAASPVSFGDSKVPARDLLYRVLSDTSRKFYWRLLFDPASKAYVLDIHLMSAAKSQ